MMNKLALAPFLSLALASPAFAQAPPKPQSVVLDEAPERAPAPERALDAGERWSMRATVRRALEVAPDVGVARARLAGAEAASAEAWAAVLPRVQVSARYTYVGIGTQDPLVQQTGDLNALEARAQQIGDPAARDVALAQIAGLRDLADARIELIKHQVAFNANVAYPVSQLFLEILPGIEATEIGEEARARELEATRADVSVQAVTWLMNHARAKAAHEVAESRRRRALRDLEGAEARMDAELGNRPDVLRFRARLAEAEREVALRRASVTSTAAGFKALLDLEGRGAIAVDEPITSLPPVRPLPQAEEMVARAQAGRPEVLAIEAWAESTSRGAAAARGAMWPSLSVALGADYARPNTIYTPPGDRFRPSWTASAVLSWSPDGAYTASRRADRIESDAAVLRRQRAALLDGVRVEVETALADYRAGVTAMRAVKDQVEAAEEAYAARRKGYELGVTTITELLAAEVEAHRANLALVDAGADLRIRQARLRRAVGEPVG